MDYIVQKETLQELAEKARGLSGTTESVYIRDMLATMQEVIDEVDTQATLLDDATEAIAGKAQGGGTVPTGTIEITENGEHDVSEYAIANVNVAASGGDDAEALKGLIDRSITSVTIPNGITKIGNNVFDECGQLTSVVLPESVKILGDSAFRYCGNMYIDHLPSNLVLIGDSCFSRMHVGAGHEYCAGSRVAISTIPRTVSFIGSSAFASAFSSLNTDTSGEITFLGTPYISSSIFLNCTQLKTINVPWAEGAVSGAPWGATQATINYNVGPEYPKTTIQAGTYIFNEQIPMPPCGRTDLTFIYQNDTRTGNAFRVGGKVNHNNLSQYALEYLRSDTGAWVSVYGFSSNTWYNGLQLAMRTVKIQTDQEIDADVAAWFLENTVKQ